MRGSEHLKLVSLPAATVSARMPIKASNFTMLTVHFRPATCLLFAGIAHFYYCFYYY